MVERALVTGGSAGIGEAFARELAGRGADLVLVARGEERLRSVAEEFRGKFRVDVEVLPADLVDSAQLAAVESRLASRTRPIDLLVNNAGFASHGNFMSLPLDVEEREVRLNVIAVVRLAHAALTSMRERGRGGVLNVSSIAGFHPFPGSATYAGTKAFVTSFTHALHEELRGSGLRCMAVCPGLTRTTERPDDYSAAIPDFVWASPEAVATGALDAYDKGRVVHITGGLNRAIAGLATVLPRVITRKLAAATSHSVR